MYIGVRRRKVGRALKKLKYKDVMISKSKYSISEWYTKKIVTKQRKSF